MHWPRGQQVKGQGHRVTKTVTFAWLLVTMPRILHTYCNWATCGHCRRGVCMSMCLPMFSSCFDAEHVENRRIKRMKSHLERVWLHWPLQWPLLQHYQSHCTNLARSEMHQSPPATSAYVSFCAWVRWHYCLVTGVIWPLMTRPGVFTVKLAISYFYAFTTRQCQQKHYCNGREGTMEFMIVLLCLSCTVVLTLRYFDIVIVNFWNESVITVILSILWSVLSFINKPNSDEVLMLIEHC